MLPPEQIPALVDGIAGIGELGNCDAVLSGYLGSAAQGRAILDVVARIKQANPRALYATVMGHPEKGCIVAPEVSDFLLEEAAAVADYLCPNQLELDSFCDRQPNSLADCVEMLEPAGTRSQGNPGKAPELSGQGRRHLRDAAGGRRSGPGTCNARC